MYIYIYIYSYLLVDFCIEHKERNGGKGLIKDGKDESGGAGSV